MIFFKDGNILDNFWIKSLLVRRELKCFLTGKVFCFCFFVFLVFQICFKIQFLRMSCGSLCMEHREEESLQPHHFTIL